MTLTREQIKQIRENGSLRNEIGERTDQIYLDTLCDLALVGEGGIEMAKAKTRLDYVKETAEALSDLNMAAAIVALCESGLFHSKSYRFEAHIVRLCKAEIDRCLTRYDRARALATRESTTQEPKPDSAKRGSTSK